MVDMPPELPYLTSCISEMNVWNGGTMTSERTQSAQLLRGRAFCNRLLINQLLVVYYTISARNTVKYYILTKTHPEHRQRTAT